MNRKIVSCWLIIINYCIYPMQDDSNVNVPAKNMSVNGKCKSKITPLTPKIKNLLNKYFTLNCVQLMHKACHILYSFTNQCHCLHFHSQCLHHTRNIPYHHCHFTTYHQSHPLHWICNTS